MDRLILLLLLCVFFIAIGKLVSDGDWGYAASIIAGLLIERERFRQLWDESQDGTG